MYRLAQNEYIKGSDGGGNANMIVGPCTIKLSEYDSPSGLILFRIQGLDRQRQPLTLHAAGQNIQAIVITSS